MSKPLQWSSEFITNFNFRINFSAQINQRGLAECLNSNYRPPSMPQLLGDKMHNHLGYTVPTLCPKIERSLLRDRHSHSHSRPKKHRLTHLSPSHLSNASGKFHTISHGSDPRIIT